MPKTQQFRDTQTGEIVTLIGPDEWGAYREEHSQMSWTAEEMPFIFEGPL